MRFQLMSERERRLFASPEGLAGTMFAVVFFGLFGLIAYLFGSGILSGFHVLMAGILTWFVLASIGLVPILLILILLVLILKR